MWPRGLSQQCIWPAQGSGVFATHVVVVHRLSPAALVIAFLCPASLRRSASSPGPNRPLSCTAMPVTPTPPLVFPYLFSFLSLSVCLCLRRTLRQCHVASRIGTALGPSWQCAQNVLLPLWGKLNYSQMREDPSFESDSRGSKVFTKPF